jgi:hypothetical protein
VSKASAPRNRPLARAALATCILFATESTPANQNHYPWLPDYDAAQALSRRIPTPDGFDRTNVADGGFDAWLRELPVKSGRPPVLLYDGRLKANQSAHAAVVDVDVGRRDLQQCADAIIRLRAEYLFSVSRLDEIVFNFTSGDEAPFSLWAQGLRPRVRGSNVRWIRSGPPDASRSSFRRYLDVVFIYAGSHSLERELCRVPDPSTLRAGDVFIQGGFPGHAVLVVDVAAHRRTGRAAFLLAQSYMPAQEIHVLNNPEDPALSPWYALDFGDVLVTPEWIFRRTDLRRFCDDEAPQATPAPRTE